jgi:serine/threonine protein kinase/Flp pilus assembly protein TadD
MSIAVGTRFDRFEVLSLLGVGGMGEVYLAQDTRLRRKVALKILPSQFTSNADRLRRFEQEAYAASSLNHPNLVTIFEIGNVDGAHFMAHEYIDGQSLWDRMKRERLPLLDALAIAFQIATALNAAHEAGIVHRDIKPKNVMLRRDGIVKVLDFGLAKLAEQQRAIEVDSAAATIAKITTDPGAVMGTPQYMSPEQARGQKADARTDIFSLGVVLYEMIAGQPPFDGVNAIEVMGAILKTEPAPLKLHVADLSPQLEHIVSRALRKDREERYQRAKDLLIDLKDYKEELAFEAKLERSVQPDKNRPVTQQTAAAPTGETAAVATQSSGKIILGEIKRHRLGVAFTLAAIVIAAVAVFFWFNRAPALTDKDTVLLADFVNTTGDAVFDGTLKQALAVQLEQSPFLSIFSEERVRESLRFMGRPPDERVTRDVAREICQRQGLKAMLLGSIAKFERNYAIHLEAVNAQSGESIARQQVEAEGKDQVLKALGGAAAKLREKLGESLASIQKYDAPIEQVTTSSLEALKAFAQGNEQQYQGKLHEAIPFYQRAVELDSNFALAWARLAFVYSSLPLRKLELAAKAAEKAFELRDRVSEREKLVISERYYANGAVNQEKRNEILELWTRSYPRDGVPHLMLGAGYVIIGQFEKAIEEIREAIRLNPNAGPAYSALALAFIRLNRFDEAREICERALQQKLDSPALRSNFYVVAFIQGNEAEMRRQIDWATGKPSEYLMLNMQSELAATSGRLRQAHELSRLTTEMAARRDLLEYAGAQTALTAEWSAVLGDCRGARENIARASAYPRSPASLWRISLAHALCGEVRQAQTLTDEIVRQYPGELIVETLVPLTRAAIEIRRGARAQALQILQSVSRYERASYFIPNYLRGQIYLSEKKGAEAAAEFQKIIDHRGWSPTSAMYVPAHLWLAQAAVIQGDLAKARKSYQDFIALWKDADPDLPILIEAKKEYEKVR